MPKISNTTVLGLVKAENSSSQKLQILAQEVLKHWGYIYPTSIPKKVAHPHILGCIVDPDAINYELLKNWIRFCTTCHTSTCQVLEESASPSLRVIDCSTRKVIDAPKNCKYVAMSYVWGQGDKNNKSCLLSPETGALPGNLPTVIEDAIVVVQKLGLRFLWIDRYCIIQNDDSDVIKHMGVMDLIYNHAHLTIIAAAGSDPYFGLPGVGSRPRLPQPSTQIRDYTLVSTLPDPQEVVKSSTWMTRAWVYQEALFSIRRLIFTEHQVYFECNNMHCYESVNTPLEAFHTNDQRRFRTCVRHGLFRGGFGKRCWPLTSHIQKYSEKSLTYQSDILRGMLGIFRAFNRSVNPIHHIWGVPIEFDMDLTNWKQQPSVRRQYSAYPWKLSASFARGLCWSLQYPASRRPEFPSWSWTGWAGPIREWPTFENLSAQENPEIHFRVNLSDDHTIDIHKLYSLTSGNAAVSQTSHYLEIEAWSIQIRIVSKASLEMSQGVVKVEDTSQGKDMSDLYVKVELNNGSPIYSPLILSKQIDEGCDFMDELRSKTWECIILGYRKQAVRSPVVLVLDLDGDTAERIGLVDFWTSWSVVDGDWTSVMTDDRMFEKTRRKLRLK
ncbi:HET-domain-containing protein [Lepidopterella palustris CBS 459.81]|uniref:HET-domain-containing protein n=1 Tax=Lepidopterella palustris CBS 459.81 TaxID=1314670 RepID=A0A8E2EMB2_9PEZI|nr:HET-domain-containing protein [Lepidopterella palustris CBS 459.81]